MRIACVLGDGFEDSEYQQPADAYVAAGHEVTVIGVRAGQDLKGKAGQVTVKSDKAIGDVRADDFDALFIPGGHSPDRIRIDRRMVDFAREFMTADKPVFAICHGPQLLITARAVKGRRMTAWPTIQDDLEQVGASVTDEEVVVDGRLVTSRKPDDIPAFNRESLSLLQMAGTGAR
jgi:protease I